MKQVFYDPQRKRWKRLRRVLDVSAVVLTVVLAVFAFSVIKRQSLPELLLPTQKRNYKALKTAAGSQKNSPAASAAADASQAIRHSAELG